MIFYMMLQQWGEEDYLHQCREWNGWHFETRELFNEALKIAIKKGLKTIKKNNINRFKYPWKY